MRSEYRAQFPDDPNTYTGSELGFGAEQRQEAELRAAIERVKRGDYSGTEAGTPFEDEKPRRRRDTSPAMRAARLVCAPSIRWSSTLAQAIASTP